MTLAITTSETTVVGDSATTTFSYGFPMGGTSSYAQLILTAPTGFTSSISSSLFSISGVTNPAGGTFTYPLIGSAITPGMSLTLKRVVPLVQDTSIANQGTFAPAITEGALDYATMALQQLQQEIGDLQTAVGGGITAGLQAVSVNTISGTTYTLSSGDNYLIFTNASTVTVSVPTDATNFVIGSVINLTQNGTGTVTVTGSTSSVTVNTLSSYTISGRYGLMSLVKEGSNTWKLAGNLM